MKKVLLLLSLSATVAIFIAVIPKVYAQDNRNDPQLNGCTSDAQSLDSASRQFRVPYNIERNGEIVIHRGDLVSITVELRWSRRCQSRWVKAIVPKGTRMYLKDNYGKKYVEYTAEVNRQNYSDMLKDIRSF